MIAFRMTSYSDGVFIKFLILVLLCQVLSLAKPFTDGNSAIKEIFSESKREVPSAAGPAVVPLFKTSLVNPYLFNPTITPEKSILYPFLSSPEVQQSRLPLGPPTAINFSNPTLISAYFKAKKNEFLMKLMEKLMNSTTVAPSEKNSRSALMENDETIETGSPSIDSSFFLKKKTKFLETLFKTLAESNMSSTVPVNETRSDDDSTTYTTPSTPKPTIVPPDFWFPFTKLGKTPKPPKPPKPTKAPKAKKILKEALDTILLQSLLIDLGVDPQQTEITKRATAGDTSPKTLKSKKVKSKEFLSSVHAATPKLYSTDSPANTLSDCMEKLFKILNKTESENLKLCVSPKETEYDPNMDEFLNFLFEIFKELNINPVSTKTENLKKLKVTSPKKLKRSTFLDELLHRISTTTTPSPMTTTESFNSLEEDNDVNFNCTLIKEFVNECLCENKLMESAEASVKTQRSLIFRPFGLGYWIPQYIYAAKMGMYLDKLMDSINTAAATDVENTVESSNVLKRSLNSASNEDTTALPSKEAALKLIISELSELKNSLIEAFLEGIKAQKDALPTQKSYGTSGKSFKKPFWGGSVLPTVDPLAPIQKRIDVLNDVFDKLTMVEKTLIFTSEPEYDPKLLTNLTEILQLASAKSKTSQPKNPYFKVPDNSESYSDFLSKIKEYLLNQSIDSSANK